METNQKAKKKKGSGCFSLKCSIILSYLVSISSNCLLIATLVLTDHSYKWAGFVFHFLVLICCVLSLRHLLNYSKQNLLRYRTMTKFYAINLVITGIFYVGVIIYLFITKTDMDLIYYLAFCILVWCIFHVLFINVIQSFIKSLEDRPAQKGTKTVDNNLKDLMLSN